MPERMARPGDMAGHEDEEGEADLQALRDENDSLRAECQELRAENKQLNDSINEITGMLPPSYDADDSPEEIIRTFIKDMNNLGRFIAKLTADYR